MRAATMKTCRPRPNLASFAFAALCLSLAGCTKPAEPFASQSVVQQSTGLEYQVLTLQDFVRSPIQAPRFYYSADSVPTIPHRHVAVLIPVSGCRAIESSVRQFVEVTSGQSVGAIMRRDPRGNGREGVLHDPATEAGMLAFRNPALTVERIIPQVRACEQYRARHGALIQPIYLVLVRIEDSESNVALYDRYVEDIVFAQTHVDVGEWATQQLIAGIVLP